MLLIFAGTYYWLNVDGWAMERAGKDRDGRANTVRGHRTHTLWRLGHGGLQVGDVVWRTLWRAQMDFRHRIPSVNRIAREDLVAT